MSHRSTHTLSTIIAARSLLLILQEQVGHRGGIVLVLCREAAI